MDSQVLAPERRPFLNPMYILRWEEAQQAHVLLYPEGIVKLNDTAAEILGLCDGERSIETITAVLAEAYDGGDVAASIARFLEVAHAKGWIRTDS